MTQSAPPVPDTSAVVAKLSLLDRFLPVWILAAMGLGLALGAVVPAVGEAMESMEVAGVSLPIAIGLLIMMYPVLAKVRYNETGRVLKDKKLVITSLVINWVLAPAFMFVLAWVFLADLPEYRTGLIIVGLARCIAMVLIWNDLACGDREAAAVLVAVNSVFQVFMFGVLGWFYLQVLPSWLGLATTSAEFSIVAITVSVLVFLGIPLLAGYLTRTLGEKARGREWYEAKVLPKIGPWALYGLLFTIVVLFALQGDQVLSSPMDVVRIAIPLLVYFVVIFAASMVIGWLLRMGYERTTTLSFTAAGNNFELAIAVSIATFGATSGQALAGVVGPLIEVPVLVALVYVALWARRFFNGSNISTTQERPIAPVAPHSL
ncbi:ACR3 family arsenite efflux transporter [Nesterenkonia jeotgali]|uniref:ACR3 family arsenite transporter n=1 Tax=Nesterenkonia jeotgali TaxID=317018 RepID=A0A0W8IIN7_9MICC|nr:ACR3 family arsenite efflux transporter [Nesterenkonia jeotgali]KUG59782.1 arsenic transporter [Nesterenkonia jeotgali]MBA8921886.1 ACR3 family arsenite transporter [Nesterenkonia jeotgali]